MLDDLNTLARTAGQEIMRIYEGAIEVERKDDNSPLTAADLASHNAIVAGLKALTPEIPILSEEGASLPFATRQTWSRYWLVDPLDGTKEFIKRNGEFTVNIALVEDGVASLAVVYAPAKDTAYLARLGSGAWRQQGDGELEPIHCARLGTRPWQVLVSRSHRSPEVEALLAQLPDHEPVSAGSSLKFCLIATGEADLYPRLGPTSEWDTAAGQCVLEAAGGLVVQMDGAPLRYNRKESLLNPYFLAAGDPDHDWATLLRAAQAG